MSELPKRAEDKVNTFGVVLIGISSSILLWATIVLLQAYYDSTAGSLEKERDAMYKSQEVRSLRAKQKADLQALKRVKAKVGDAEKDLVTIPIDVAMERVIADLKTDPAGSLVPALGAHDQPTIPAEAGRPPDDVQPPETEGEEGEGEEEQTPEDLEEEERGASDEEATRELDEATPDEGAADREAEAARRRRERAREREGTREREGAPSPRPSPEEPSEEDRP